MANGENTTGRPGDVGLQPEAIQSSAGNAEADVLRSIDATLNNILRNVQGVSQSSARQFGARSSSSYSDNRWATRGSRIRRSSSSSGFQQFTDSFLDQLEEGLLSSDVKNIVRDGINTFAQDLGVNISDIPKALGKEFGKKIMSSGPGQAISKQVNSFISKTASKAMTSYSQGKAAALAASQSSAGAAVAGLGKAAVAVGPQLLAVGLALRAFDKALEGAGEVLSGFGDILKAYGKTMNRDKESRSKNAKLASERMAADVATMIEEPFRILKEAANSLYQVWDSQLRTISATQGYDKAGVQDLMAVYAQRLRDEGLTRVVSGADIMTNLSSVLKAGLSGEVAEEFAYLATKLNAAVPTQDFFSYASTYASVAANAIRMGKSQSEAIAYANQEMESFASNVLYASRELAGGFSTGLQNAQSLFDSAVRIAQSSKVGDVAQISGVLTSVSAITGAVAPDLANGLVSAVVDAAVGGNASNIVALRSLAGVNASNTEFLRTLANDPQAIFAELFTNLARMQNMSNDNFMEVAEGLSSVFNVSMDAFARVDFNYLAKAIAEMNVNNASLDQNMELLVSGQTTTSTEQLKMAQINQYMLEEGLSYVLDNQAARAIQEHMWDEQRKRELMEATYAVDLTGQSMEAMAKIMNGIEKIFDAINPFSWFKKLGNAFKTDTEAFQQRADIAQMLELTKVGASNQSTLYGLTTTNQDLMLTNTLVNLLGGQGLYGGTLANNRNIFDKAKIINMRENQSAIASAIAGPSSVYGWGTMGKSTAAYLLGTNAVGTGGVSAPNQRSGSATSQSVQSQTNAKLQKFLDTMEAAVKEDGSTYAGWTKTASKFGIANLSAMLQDAGISESDLEAQWGQRESQKTSEYTYNRNLLEDEFWKQATAFATNAQTPWLNWEDEVLKNQTELIDIQKTYLNEWTKYYVDHEAYSAATFDAFRAADIIHSEKAETGDAVLALAKALTANTVGITQGFKDPVVQTNALLAQILVVAEAIMQQNNKPAGQSLLDTLAANAMGITVPTY